jgi:hypothetical protein
MSPQLSLSCVNCGTTLQQPARGLSSVLCPVCHLLNDVRPAAQATIFSRDALERGLGDLITRARAGGLGDDEILAALRDELEFTAELTHAGHQICVQIVDLGPQAGQNTRQPVRDRAATLRSRTLGG